MMLTHLGMACGLGMLCLGGPVGLDMMLTHLGRACGLGMLCWGGAGEYANAWGIGGLPWLAFWHR